MLNGLKRKHSSGLEIQFIYTAPNHNKGYYKAFYSMHFKILKK